MIHLLVFISLQSFFIITAQANDGTEVYEEAPTSSMENTPVYDYSSGSAVIVNEGELGGGEQNINVPIPTRRPNVPAKNETKRKDSQKFNLQDLKNYSKRDDVKKMIKHCMRNGMKQKIRGLCWRHVKKVIRSSKMAKEPFGRWASRAGNSLSKEGFINLLAIPEFKAIITSPTDPDIPPGAILVYDGTNSCRYVKLRSGGKDCKKPVRSNLTTVKMGSGWGHIEVFAGPQKVLKKHKKDVKNIYGENRKTANYYCYDGLTPKVGSGSGFEKAKGMVAGTGRRKRKLIGVWVKP